MIYEYGLKVSMTRPHLRMSGAIVVEMRNLDGKYSYIGFQVHGRKVVSAFEGGSQDTFVKTLTVQGVQGSQPKVRTADRKMTFEARYIPRMELDKANVQEEGKWYANKAIGLLASNVQPSGWKKAATSDVYSIVHSGYEANSDLITWTVSPERGVHPVVTGKLIHRSSRSR